MRAPEEFYIDELTVGTREPILPHQQDAIDAMHDYFKTGRTLQNRNGLLVMPTGSGKTYTAVHWLLTDGIAKGYRIVWLVHRQELVKQTYNEFQKSLYLLKDKNVKNVVKIFPISGDSEHGRMRNAIGADIYICCRNSIVNKNGYRFIERMLGEPGKRKLIIVCDEAHHAVSRGYRRVITRMTNLNPNRILLGLTATPYRMSEDEQAILQDMFNVNKNLRYNKGINGFVYQITNTDLIRTKFLAAPIPVKVPTNIDSKFEFDVTDEDIEFFKKTGDISERLQREVADSSQRNKLILDHYLKNRKKYGKTLIFVSRQNQAKHLCEDLNAAGVSCDYAVSGKPESQDTIQAFKDNKFDVLVNVQMLTEGSDVPDIQTVLLARPTFSRTLYEQMMGRALRGPKAGGTEYAYIVDFQDNWDMFGDAMSFAKTEYYNAEVDDETIIEEDPIDVVPDTVNLEILRCLFKNGVLPTPEQKVEPVGMQEDLYAKLYAMIYDSLNTVPGEDVFVPEMPVGWYSVTDEDGLDRSVLVFESQLPGYKRIAANAGRLRNVITIDGLKALFFNDCSFVPSDEDLECIIDDIDDDGIMPDYFSFEERDSVDPVKISAAINSKDYTDEQKEELLKKYYDSYPILKDIYHSFFAFKKTVMSVDKENIESKVTSHEGEYENLDYDIVDNCYDLNELLAEVLQMYPKLSAENVLEISWSEDLVGKWFGCCDCAYAVNENRLIYQLHINRMLSSPQIDREVIKYLIFHELLHANGYWNHDNAFRTLEWSYPNSGELDAFLDGTNLKYNLGIKDKVVKNETYNFDKYSELGPIIRSPGDMPPEISPDVTAEQPKEEPTIKYNPKAPGIIEGFKYCRNCGNKLPADAKFCDKCGNKVDY